MILVDTSVWIDHFRSGDTHLSTLLDHGMVQTHDFIIGEIACGNLKNRQQTLYLFSCLPRCTATSPEETLFFIERHGLMGRGIGEVMDHSDIATVNRWGSIARCKRMVFGPFPSDSMSRTTAAISLP